MRKLNKAEDTQKYMSFFRNALLRFYKYTMKILHMQKYR